MKNVLTMIVAVPAGFLMSGGPWLTVAGAGLAVLWFRYEIADLIAGLTKTRKSETILVTGQREEA